MTDTERRSPSGGPSDETVRDLANLAGLRITAERLPEVTAKLGELYGQLGRLDSLDLSGLVPRSAFDPRWEEEA